MIRSVSCVLVLLVALASVAQAEESGYLGVVLGQLPDGVAGPAGAIVQEVLQDSPADRVVCVSAMSSLR